MNLGKLIVMVGVLNFSAWTAGPNISMEPGTYSAGGFIKSPMVFQNNGRTSITLEAAPFFGLYIVDHLEMSAGPIGRGSLWDSDPAQAKKMAWGAFLQSRYYLALGANIYAYFGLGFSLVAGGSSADDITSSILIPLGVLIPLNKYVGLSLGAPATIDFTRSQFSEFSLSPGYLGVQTFF